MDTNRVFDGIIMHLFNEKKKIMHMKGMFQEDLYRIPSNCITIITCNEHPPHSHFIHQYLLLIFVFRVPTIKLCTFIVSIISYQVFIIIIKYMYMNICEVKDMYTLVLKYFIIYLAFYVDDRYTYTFI